MTKAQLLKENERLRDELKIAKAPHAVRISADGVQMLSPRKAAMLAAKAQAAQSGRVVTVVVTKSH